MSSSHPEDLSQKAVLRTEWMGTSTTTSQDLLVREEPLEIRLGGVPLAVVMRTPGHDEELGWGFLLTERVVETPEQIRSVRHCTTVEHPEAEDNILLVTLADGVTVDLERLRRNLYASSSCGICGKATLENALAHAPPVVDDLSVSSEFLFGLPDALRARQEVFEQTGGLHGAGLFDPTGKCLVVREDVGRHNAVDKLVGWAATHQTLPLGGRVLMVSGRVSYEIIQKALAARIPIVAAVSAPSSLAVDLAEEAGITLVGFLRDKRMCVYTHGHRITGAT